MAKKGKSGGGFRQNQEKGLRKTKKGKIRKNKGASKKASNKNGGEVKDARDKIMSLAKKTDARERLQKIRNLKDGKLEVKTTSGGAITITKTTKGQTLLTTKKKELGRSSRKPEGSVKRTLGRGGTLSLNTKKQTSTLVGLARSRPQQVTPSSRSTVVTPSQSHRRDHSRKSSSTPLVRTIRGTNVLSEAVRLDRELMNTKIDPVALQRTVRQHASSSSGTRHRGSSGTYRSRERSPLAPYRPPGSRRDSSPFESRMRSIRSRSPDVIDVDRYQIRSGDDFGGRKYHYDDPRSELEREAEAYRKLRQQPSSFDYGSNSGSYSPWTMGDRKEQLGVSPLQGVKVVVSNLQSSVSQEDIVELFGDIGALKRAKMSGAGVAEVVFVNRADAQKAVEIYHNRQLDGKAMKCQVVGGGGGYVSQHHVTGGYR